MFFFFDFVDELSHIGKSFNGSLHGSYQVQHALLYVMLLMPNHLYELLPITVLIGGVLVMARFAQTSEFTILRTSGLGPLRALGTLLALWLVRSITRPIALASATACSPIAWRVASLMKGDGASSITFWWRRWIEHSRSFR